MQNTKTSERTTVRWWKREWLVIESGQKHAVFASDEARNQRGYIPRDVADTRRYMDKLILERHELLMLKYAPINPSLVVKVCDAI